MPDIIISVHVPKCAGESFGEALEDAFGPADMYYDYDDSPFNPTKPVNTDPNYFQSFDKNSYGFLRGKRVVHGHFHPNKYKALSPALRVTVLREPVERLISHYFFWKHHPRHHHPLHDYMLDHQLSLEAFAEIPSVKHFYSGVFFKDVDMNIFDAVGKFGDMEKFLSTFFQRTQHHLVLPVTNANPQNNYSHLKNEILNDTKRIECLRALLSEDTAFYEHWAGKGC